MNSKPDELAGMKPNLGLGDAVSLILGIIIGAGIFETPYRVFALVPQGWQALVIWGVAGLLALIGALCFAELASTYPRSGGEYVYLTRAFGSIVGYLFAWAQLSIIRPAGIASVTYIFAHNACRFFDLDSIWNLPLTLGCITVLTLINILGVHFGKFTQNLLTGAKVLGLFTLIFVGFWKSAGQSFREIAPMSGNPSWILAAMIPVLWTYSGWHEAAYVAAEVKNRSKNLPRALLLGTLGVTLLYVLINAALLYGLGSGARLASASADVFALAWPQHGSQVMALLICISTLGAVNGMIFTTARIYVEFGVDHRLFEPLSHWSRNWGTPIRALWVQGAICLGLTLFVWILGQHESDMNDLFTQLLYLTAAVFWGFFLLTGIALFVLRRKDRDIVRPFRVPGYPVLPIIFCTWCAVMMVGAIYEKPIESCAGIVILAIGLVFYHLPQRTNKRTTRELHSVPRSDSI